MACPPLQSSRGLSQQPGFCSFFSSRVCSVPRERHRPRNTHACVLSCSSVLLSGLKSTLLGTCSIISSLSSLSNGTLKLAVLHEQCNRAAVQPQFHQPIYKIEACREAMQGNSDIQQQMDVMFLWLFFFPKISAKAGYYRKFLNSFNNATCT